MKKVMILGAGRGQIPIMEICKKYGWYVIAVSPEGNYPGLKVADEVFYENVKDCDSILEYAKKVEIKGIITDQLDAGVFTAAYVAEKMGLNGITADVARRFTDKYIMRQEAAKRGISVPPSVVISKYEEIEEKTANLKFPLMMKPVDNAASRGVYKVNSMDEIRNNYERSLSYSRTKKIIIEEFICGKEYVVEAFTRNYKVKNLVVGHRDYFRIENVFIPNATVFIDADSANDAVEEALKEANEKLVKAFGLKFGITHAEFIYNEAEHKVYLVEIAARGGGVFISSDLIPMACGVNANELLVKEALGIPYDQTITLTRGASAYFCYLVPEGTVTKLDNVENVNKIEGVSKAFFDNIAIGMKTGLITDKSSRKGPILVKGKNKRECYSVIEEVKSVLDVKIKTQEDERDIIWG